MKYITMGLFIIMVAISAFCFGFISSGNPLLGIEGPRTIVPFQVRVKVLNFFPLIQRRYQYSDSELVRGNECFIEHGGEINAIWQISSDVIVHYTSPDELQIGTSCPTGAIFSIEKAFFSSMYEQYIAIRNGTAEEKELVQRLLSENFYGETTVSGDIGWTRVINLDTVRHHGDYYNIAIDYSYGDKCIIESGGTIQSRGEANENILYEYKAPGNPFGTHCPSGALFWSDLNNK